MGKYPDADRRWELRRRIDAADNDLEVSELEKILSHLAYLANLYLSDRERWPDLANAFKTHIGHSASRHDLKEGDREWIASVLRETGLGNRPCVLFHMWRAWLLQKELGYSNEPRDYEEWFSLPDDVNEERMKMLATLDELGENLMAIREELPQTAEEAKYVMGNISGSPLAVTNATIRLLAETQQRLRGFEARLRECYGFGENHRPNKRFDRMARRNIDAFYLWKTRQTDDTYTTPFLKGEADDPKARARAKNAADKAASRFEETLTSYEGILVRYEDKGDVPTAFHARRLAPT